jgi:two-component system, response regulator, stage 0 sporulation protein F
MAYIVIIDDDPAIRGTLRKILERDGYRVDEAADGEEGLRLVEAGEPALVVTDLLMPEKEGIETIQELAERFPDVRILAISGAGGGEDKEGPLTDAILFGAHAVLPKPFSVSDFQNRVRELLN